MPVDKRGDDLGSLLNQSLSDPPASADEATARLRAAEFRSEEAAGREDMLAFDEADVLNPWVYVPAHPVIRNGAELAEYELRELADGSPVLPAFTSVERLIEQLGWAQPWLKARISAVVDLVGGDHVAVDPVIDPSAPRWDSEELEKFTETFEAERRGGSSE